MNEYCIQTFEHYLLSQKRVTRNTLESYMLDLHQFNDFLTRKKLAVEQVQEKDLLEFFHLLRKQKKLSARSLSRKISSLKVFYSYMHERFNYKDVTVGLVYPKLEKRLPNFLTEEEIYTILQCAQQDTTSLGQRNNMLLKLLYITGIRISEAINVKLSDINIHDNLLLIQGKGNKERLIPIPAEFTQELLTFIKFYHETVLKKQTNEFLFAVKSKGKIKNLTRQAAWLILKQIVARSSIKKRVTPHTLRHSLATHLLEKGAHLRSLQVWLGHENISTVEIYTHVNTEHLRKIYDKKHPRS